MAHWVNQRLNLSGEKAVDKRHPGIQKIYHWIKRQYDEEERLTTMGNDELEREARKHLPELFHSEFDRLKFWAQTLAARPGHGADRPARNEDHGPGHHRAGAGGVPGKEPLYPAYVRGQ